MTPTNGKTKDSRSPIYSQPRERFLYLYATNACQLRCKHCYVGNDRLNSEDMFSVQLANEVLDYFRIVGGHDKLYILGGEPTLHPQLDQIVRLAVDCGYSVTISSNGDFDDNIFDHIPSSMLASFNFSLESADQAIHRAIRGNPRSFDRVTSRISEARRRGYQVRVMCTVSHANRATALAMIPFAAKLGAHSLSFHNLGRTGNANSSLTPLSPSEWIAFCAEIEAYPPDDRIAVYYPPTFVPIENQQQWADRGYPGCPARTLDRPHVYPDGTVYACPLFMDGQRHYARFDGGRLLLNTASNNEMNAILTMDSACTGCSAVATCGGGCPAYSGMPAYGDWYSCDRQVTPLCILWTTYAWNRRHSDLIHNFR